MQALQLVADVHSLADQVRSKCGYKDAERAASGALTPRFEAIRENDNQVCIILHASPKSCLSQVHCSQTLWKGMVSKHVGWLFQRE